VFQHIRLQLLLSKKTKLETLHDHFKSEKYRKEMVNSR